MRSKLALSLGLAGLILGACGSTGAEDSAEEIVDSRMAEILSLEYTRVGVDELLEIMSLGSAAERERVASALGRFPVLPQRAISRLVGARRDEDERVHDAATFSLGIRREPQAAKGLYTDISYSSFSLQVWWGQTAKWWEAVGRGNDDRSRELVMSALDLEAEHDSEAIDEAVIATHRWGVDEPSSHVVDERLVSLLRELDESESDRREVDSAPQIELVWRILFSLQRRNAARLAAIEALDGETTLDPYYETNARARESFLLWARSTDARARLYAVQGLGTLEYDEVITRELHHALKDNDWRVVCDACAALSREVTEENLEALIIAAKHANPHVRRVAILSLGEYVDLREKVGRTLDATNADVSSSVQAAAIVTAAELYGDHSAAQLELKRLKQDAVIRAGVAEATRYLSSELALPMIETLAQDSNLRVAGFALESLGAHKTPESRTLLREHLQHEDNGLRLMALLALKEMLIAEDLPYLWTAFENTSGDNIADEFRFNVVKALASIDNKLSTRMLLVASGAEHDYTRRLAEKEIDKRVVFTSCLKSKSDDAKARVTRASDPLPKLPDELIALATATENPFVRVETTRGTLVFELFPRETPFHVYNFIELARRDHYDGLDFHRVVPNFVIQGGDTRGDGNGGTTWRGGSLPAEFTPRKYVRGSLGMPRNEDPDSGGSQFFVTHRATPHLDGRYTIFGELREGFDVLDRIEVGDKILDVIPIPR